MKDFLAVMVLFLGVMAVAWLGLVASEAIWPTGRAEMAAEEW